MDTNELVKEMLDIRDDTMIEAGIDAVFGTVPYLSNIYNAYRMGKLNKGLEENQSELLSIKEKIDRKENSVFYKQEVFPLILNKLLNEEQIEKTTIIINGFEYTVDEDINEIDTIYHFYDVLEELRLADLNYLAEEYTPSSHRNRERDLEDVKFMLNNREEYNKQQDFKNYINNKLLRLGLLQYVKKRKNDKKDYDPYTNNNTYPSSKSDEEEWDLANFELSNFGVRFINFFIED